MTPTVVVVGLGPAGADLLAPAATAALTSVPPRARFLRTTVHPAAGAVEGATSFDHRYEAAELLDDVYAGIVDDLVAAAVEHGRVVYAVPGSPLVAERTVELLRTRTEVLVEVVPALSFLDLCWARLGVDPLAAGVRLVDGHRFAVEAAGERGPLLVAQLDSGFVLSDVKLAVETAPGRPVTLLHHLGLPDERVVETSWDELDHFAAADHLTSLWIPELGVPVGAELQRFVATVRALRERCPWDREQTHASLAAYCIEEAAELAEAIGHLGAPAAYDDADPDAVDHFRDELGDVLLQVVLHATIAEQEGWFTLADVAVAIDEKMVRRHPHVFAGLEVADAAEVAENWERIKAEERAARQRP